jgi:ABC-2 type transport system ATP-binding protein
VITFYDTLHVSGRDPRALQQALEPFQQDPKIQWERIDATLEDVFIWLSRQHNKPEFE